MRHASILNVIISINVTQFRLVSLGSFDTFAKERSGITREHDELTFLLRDLSLNRNAGTLKDVMDIKLHSESFVQFTKGQVL